MRHTANGEPPADWSSFSAVEELNEANRRAGWKLEYRQLEPGGFSTQFAVRCLSHTLLMRTRSVLRNFHAKRSGDIYLVFEPNVFINDFDGLIVASTHGSPWRYDTYVPVIFAGAGLKASTVSRAVTPYDIAPTLSAYLDAKPPSGAVGGLLSEVLSN